MVNTTHIEISTWSLLKIIGLALVIYFLYLIREVAAILFVSIVLASALDPLVEWFHKKRIPRLLIILILYILMLALVSLMVVLLLPPAVHQLRNLAQDLPIYLSKITAGFAAIQSLSQNYGVEGAVQDAVQQLENILSSGGGGVVNVLLRIFGGVLSFIVVLVMTFYLLLEDNATKKTLRFLTPAKYQPFVTRILFKMRDKIGLWLRGQLFLSLIIGLIVYVGLSVFGLFYPLFAKYSLVLALAAFLFEFVPYLGPILAAIPALVIASAYGLPVIVGIGGFYVVIQWLENHLIVPQVMKHAVGLSPIIIIVALMIGAKVGGVVGVVLAIPVATALSVLIEEIFKEETEQE